MFLFSSFGECVLLAHALPSLVDLIDGRVYCWGSNTYGELGRISKHSYKPKVVSGVPTSIARLFCGDQRCCVITLDGNLWVWGRLCSQDASRDTHVPQLFDAFEGKESVWVGASGLFYVYYI